MGVDDDCDLCIGAPEDSNHIFRTCTFAVDVWKHIKGNSLSIDFFTQPFDMWWKERISDQDFGIVCWLLWKCRNEHLFEGKVASPISVVEQVRYWMNICRDSSTGNQWVLDSQKRARQEHMIRWEAAQSPWVTLNTDGSVIATTGQAATGGALRSSDGRLMDAFSGNLGKCSITRAEITGLVIGLERAWNLAVRDVAVQVDSACAVALLNGSWNLEHQHACILDRFRQLSARPWRVRVYHIYREGNHLVDFLARKGHELPMGVHNVAHTDAQLVYWGRYDIVGGSESRRVGE
ncbi:Putative ribonuclease H protein At1g65750 [Linum perenne]